MSKLKSTNWNYPTNIWFGHKRLKDINKACRELKIKNPLIVTGKFLVTQAVIKDFTKYLSSKNIKYTLFSKVQNNPNSQNVEDGVLAYKENSCDGVIAIGGGSSLDAGKTIAFMVAQHLPLWDFEDIGDNHTKANTSTIAPIIAIPTTAGTGSEVGRASVITNSETHSKKIIFHPLMLPSIVILDPNLTYDLPKHMTAWTGMDALVHSLEAYLAPGFHPMAEGIAFEAISLIKENLLKVYENGHDELARANMLVAAMMGATAFQKGLGSVHSIAHQLGGLYNFPHGLANSILLPYALTQNKKEIENKMKKLCMFLDIKNPSTDSFVDYIISLQRKLDIPLSLHEANIDDSKVDEIARLAYLDPSTVTNAKKMEVIDFIVLFEFR
jgi:hypothetical protein